jgi:hypothetical protein
MAKFFRQESSQSSLFGHVDPFKIWQRASDGSGFCTLSLAFFSTLTAEFLKYFLDREASAILRSVDEREAFQTNLEAHVERITRHSLEVSRITQSFAAGWYNKHAKDQTPSHKKISGFLSIALNKIRDSIAMENAE